MAKSIEGVGKPPRIIVNFKKMKAGSDQSDIDEHEVPERLVHKRRRTQRYCDSDSDEEITFWRAMRRKAWTYYEESDSSSESATGSFDSQNGCFQASKVICAGEKLPMGVVRGCSSCETCQKVKARWHPAMGRRPHLEDAPVYFPDEEEFSDPISYIANIRENAEPYGICRIVPPRSWRPPCPLKDMQKWKQTFPTRIQQIHKLQVREPVGKAAKECTKEGIITKDRPARMGGSNQGNSVVDGHNNEFGFEPGPNFTLESFDKYATEFKESYFRSENPMETKCNIKPTPEMIEGEYWRIVEEPTEQIEVLYGADIETNSFGSGFPKVRVGANAEELTEYERSGWNLNNMAREKGSVLAFEEADISGVVVPWLYIGMCFSSFCWHVEDHHFYSVNYMHWGSPKIWYGVPGAAAMKLEDAMRKNLPDLFKEQPDLLHKLVTQLSPSVLTKEGVPVYRAVQRPGDFVVTFPRAYHAGFNCGFNCAEAVNMAPIDWLPHGQAAIELYRELHRKASVSHDKLLLSFALNAVHEQLQAASKENEALAAKCLQFLQWPCLKQARSSSGSNYFGQEFHDEMGMLASALQVRVKMEHGRRIGLTGIKNMRRMDTIFDAVEERECIVCRYDLHLSAVGCKCSQERYVCLEHAASVCACPWEEKFLLFRHELAELDTLLTVLEGRPGALSNWIKQQELLLSEPELQPQSQNITCVSPSCLGTAVKADSRPTKLQESLEGFVADSSTVLKEYKHEEPLELNIFVESPKSLTFSNQIQKTSFYDLNLSNSRQDNCHENCIESQDIKPFSNPMTPGTLNCRAFSNPVAPGTLRPVNATPKVTRSFLANNIGLADYNKGKSLALDFTESGRNEGENNDAKASDSSLETSLCLGKSSRAKSVGEVKSASIKEEQVPSSRMGLEKCINLIKNGHNGDVNISMEHASRLFQNSAKMNTFPMEGDASRRFPAMDTRNESRSTLKVEGHALPSMNGPRIATVLRTKRVNPDVELINVGRLVSKEHWHDKHMIYPIGFKSRTSFYNFHSLPDRCYYTSEILDLGKDRPYFKVTLEGGGSEEFISSSADVCWQEIQNRLTRVVWERQSAECTNSTNSYLPEKLSGFDMFGFNSPSIVQAVEALDSDHVCSNYWTAKLREKPFQSRHSTHELDEINMLGVGAATLNSRAPREKTAVCSPQVEHANEQTVDPRKRRRNPLDEGKTYNILRNFYKKGTSSELWSLLSVFRSNWGGQEWKEGCQALTDEFEHMLESRR